MLLILILNFNCQSGNLSFDLVASSKILVAMATKMVLRLEGYSCSKEAATFVCGLNFRVRISLKTAIRVRIKLSKVHTEKTKQA